MNDCGWSDSVPNVGDGQARLQNAINRTKGPCPLQAVGSGALREVAGRRTCFGITSPKPLERERWSTDCGSNGG